MSCVSTVAFGAFPGTANTALTAGNIVYDVQVNTTATAQAIIRFTVTLATTTSNTTNQTSYGPVYIKTGASITPGQTINCKVGLATMNLQTDTSPSRPRSNGKSLRRWHSRRFYLWIAAAIV